MTEKMSPEIQQKLMEFQEAQQQARMVLAQKYQMELQLKEAQAALSAVEDVDKPEIHKVVGQILIKSDKSSVVKELNEKVDMLEVRMKSLETKEKELTAKLKSIQDRLQGVLPEAPEEEKAE